MGLDKMRKRNAEKSGEGAERNRMNEALKALCEKDRQKEQPYGWRWAPEHGGSAYTIIGWGPRGAIIHVGPRPRLEGEGLCYDTVINYVGHQIDGTAGEFDDPEEAMRAVIRKFTDDAYGRSHSKGFEEAVSLYRELLVKLVPGISKEDITDAIFDIHMARLKREGEGKGE